MSKPSVAPRSRSTKPAPVVPIVPPNYLEGRDLDELCEVARQTRVLDLAIQGLWSLSDGSMIDRWTHVEPLMYCAMELHSAVIKLEERLWKVKIQFPPKTESTEQTA